MSSLKKAIIQNIINIPGWCTNRKIIVIESDDWGSIRMPSKEVYNKLKEQGYCVDFHPYEKFDSLASEEDLTALFEILLKYKDINGNHPVFTANCVVANPDFEKIKKNNFQKYYYEPFTQTLKRYGHHYNSFELWKQGIRDNIFIPQFHGREHLNVAAWMDALQKNDQDIRLAFNYGMIGLFPKNDHRVGNQMMVALKYNNVSEISNLDHILVDGLNLFEKIFGFRSKTFIAPCYTWSPENEKTLMDNGIKLLQGSYRQIIPNSNNKTHLMGSKNRYGQYYFIRNCFFEPTLLTEFSISKCLCEIKMAFRWNKPAIISSHRVNYIGSIFQENRELNLRYLDKLFIEILKKWPDVEFMSSDKLLEIVAS